MAVTGVRASALESALELARTGRPVSLDSVATEVGLSKTGLVHHFRTKEALMLALVDHVVDRWERELGRRLDRPVSEALPHQRMTAYVDWALSGDFDGSDLVIMLDPRLRGSLTARWAQRMEPWFSLPPGTPPGRRAHLQAARLLADGAWFADATGVHPLAPDERARTRTIALDLVSAGA